MSKIGNYYIELTEQANELGFETVEEALANGYEVVRGKLQLKEDEQTKAHNAWLDEKKALVGDLKNLLIGMHASGRSDSTDYAIVEHALDFIAKGEQ